MSSNIDWNDTIKKEVRALNDEDLGEVQEIANGHVLVQKGVIDKEKFSIPQDQAESYDGSILRFKVSKDEIIKKYAVNMAPASIEEQYASTTVIDSGGGSGGGIHLEENEATKRDAKDSLSPVTEGKLDAPNSTQDQTSIIKEPVTETKTIEVPVTHEEVTIDIAPPSGQTEPQTPVSSKESITIPVKKEEVEVIKTSYVKEEVSVKNRDTTETLEVSEEETIEKDNSSNSK
ncbi:MAG: YsnF/AvaK domain-containing protein [Nitrosopumilus sp.]|nr:YsnF/AvaK domain-containing protein [Nitrosopumilus sp.]